MDLLVAEASKNIIDVRMPAQVTNEQEVCTTLERSMSSTSSLNNHVYTSMTENTAKSAEWNQSEKITTSSSVELFAETLLQSQTIFNPYDKEHENNPTNIGCSECTSGHLQTTLPCDFNCLCNLICGHNSLDAAATINVDEIYQVLGRDILKSSLLDDIDLYLECDDDNLYVVPSTEANQRTSIEVVEDPVNIRVSFPDNKDGQLGPRKRFACSSCSMTFSKRNILLDHRAKTHGENNLFRCSQCSYKGQRSSHFQKHLRRKHLSHNRSKVIDKGNIGANETQDNSIDSLRGQSSDMKTFENKKQNSEANISIDKEDISPDTQESSPPCSQLMDESIKHSASEEKDKYVCQHCKLICASRKTLWAHKHSIHNPDRQVYQCEICAQVFKQKRSLDTHLKKHRNELNHLCDICDKKFVSKSNLLVHKISHKVDRPYVCPVGGCESRFKTKSAQKGHIEVVHGEKVFSCPFDGCKKSYSTQRMLKSHTMIHSQKFCCSWPKCGKKCRDSYNLDKHFRTHTHIKDMKCPSCDFRCVQRASLNWHRKRMHSF